MDSFGDEVVATAMLARLIDRRHIVNSRGMNVARDQVPRPSSIKPPPDPHSSHRGAPFSGSDTPARPRYRESPGDQQGSPTEDTVSQQGQTNRSPTPATMTTRV